MHQIDRRAKGRKQNGAGPAGRRALPQGRVIWTASASATTNVRRHLKFLTFPKTTGRIPNNDRLYFTHHGRPSLLASQWVDVCQMLSYYNQCEVSLDVLPPRLNLITARVLPYGNSADRQERQSAQVGCPLLAPHPAFTLTPPSTDSIITRSTESRSRVPTAHCLHRMCRNIGAEKVR